MRRRDQTILPLLALFGGLCWAVCMNIGTKVPQFSHRAVVQESVGRWFESNRRHGRVPRSRETTRDFQLSHPCPSTGRATGPCPGYIKDHVRALCIGGEDSPSNMQWQTTADARAKDRWECDASDPRNR